MVKEVSEISRIVLKLLLTTSVIGIVYSLSAFFMHSYAYKESSDKYNKLSGIYHESASDSDHELSKINEEYIGWLSVDGTDIHYPVVQAVDNEYYLDRNFYREEDKVGAIFKDYRNEPNAWNDHTIIYGHNMKDDSMFGTLRNVLEDDFNSNHRIHFVTPDESFEWEIFSAYQTTNTDWMTVDFPEENDYESFINALAQSTEKQFEDAAIDTEKNIITLATCTNRASDERTVVHAKLVEGN